MPRKRRTAPRSQPPASLAVQRFGHAESIDVDSDTIVDFPEGLIGLETLHRFALLDDPRVAPCRWLQSLDDPEIAFLVVDPRLVDPSYAPELAELPEDTAAQDFDLLAIITIHAQPRQSTVNLLAPVLVDRKRRTGRQVVQHESGYSIRHPIAIPGTDDAGPAA